MDRTRRLAKLGSQGDITRSSWNTHRRHGLPDRIARDLAATILSGTYRPGDRLFGEIAFSDRFNVSRTTYRQAIQILTTKGMVSSHPRRGTIVNARSMWLFLDPDVLDLLLETCPDQHVLAELRELLQMMAPKAAALAAARRTDEMLTRMQTAIEGMKRDTPNHSSREFHVAVFQASGNSYVISTARGLAAALDVAITFRRQGITEARNSIDDHLNILAAIAMQAPDSAERGYRALIENAFLDASIGN